jgi:predicted metal-dependent RNase
MVLSIIFFLLFLGNILTTLSVLREKLREKTPPSLLKQKYQSLKTFLSTNYHRRSRSFHQFGHRLQKERLNKDNNIRVVSKED